MRPNDTMNSATGRFIGALALICLGHWFEPPAPCPLLWNGAVSAFGSRHRRRSCEDGDGVGRRRKEKGIGAPGWGTVTATDWADEEHD
jgi:hypothetical protein